MFELPDILVSAAPWDRRRRGGRRRQGLFRRSLGKQLAGTTHFIALFGEGYETSEACTYELDTVLAQDQEVTILSYLLAGRTIPNPRLRERHHPLLYDPDPRVSATAVVERVMELLRAAARSMP